MLLREHPDSVMSLVIVPRPPWKGWEQQEAPGSWEHVEGAETDLGEALGKEEKHRDLQGPKSEGLMGVLTSL